MKLTIDPPVGFSGAGPAECGTLEGGVSALDLGSIDDKSVGVDMYGSGLDEAPSAQSSGVVPVLSIQISILGGGGENGVYYGSSPEGPQILAHTAADGSRTATFESLEKLTDSSDPNFGPDTISGTISWTCR
jgi:hypothetical protein